MKSSIQLPEAQPDDRREKKLERLVSRGFDQHRWRADFEDWAHKRIWNERHQDRMVARLERYVIHSTDWKGRRVLDLGTGRGGLSVALAYGGAHVTAMDLRRRNCRILRLRAARYDLLVPAANAVGEHLPFRDGFFDLVICKDVTEHCLDPHRVLSEIRRVLAPGGRAYVTFINRLAWDDPHYHLPGVNFLPRPLAEVAVRLAQRNKQNSRDMQRLSDMHYYTLGGARRAARAAGLDYDDLTGRMMREQGAHSWRLAAHERASIGVATFEAVLRPREATP